MPEIACPYCGAPVSYAEGDTVITCPYCGSTFAITGKPLEKHLMGRVNYTINEVYSFFKEWALRKPETPNDLPALARLENYELSFYPYWVYRIDASVEYEGRVSRRVVKGVEEEAVVVSVPAHKSMYGTSLERHRFSLRGKVFFNSSYARKTGGKILNANVDEKSAWRKALEEAVNAVLDKVRQRGVQMVLARNVEYKVDGPYYVHIPVYRVTYSYGGSKYVFLADATDNRIIYSEIPLGAGFRALAITASILTLAVGVILMLAGMAMKAPAFGATSLLTLLIVSGYVAYRGLRRKLVVK